MSSGQEPLLARVPSLAELVRHRAQELRDRPAFAGAQRAWNYAELDTESSRIAQGLAAAGIGSGDTIACLTRHGAECVLLLLAASKLGCVLAPLNWRLGVAELEYLFGVVRPKAVLADAFLGDTLSRVQVPGSPLRLVTDAVECGLGEWASRWPAQDPGAQPSGDAVAAVLFSSGTTGHPKGVEITHGAILQHCALWTPVFGYGATTRQLNVLPTFHVSGVVNAVWMLYLGGVATFQPEFVPERFLETIEQQRITDAFAVPTMLRLLVGTPRIATTDLSSLRSISYGGSPIDPALLAECMLRFRCRLLQVYGMTEAAGVLTTLGSELLTPVADRAGLMASVGRPGPHIDLKVVHPTDLLDCPDGEVGEVWVRAAHLMRGYFRDEPATTAAFPNGREPPGGWMRTGDAGILRDGYLFLVDRIKDMLISGGENIYPAEIEKVLVAHPAVAEVAVIGVPDETWGETVKACVVLKSGASATAAELIAYARERLAHYKCPTSVDFFAELPRNPSGKVLKRELRRPFWVGRSRNIA